MGRVAAPIALDVGEHTVKVVQLERRGRRLALREARCVEVGPGTDGAARRQRQLDACRRALRNGSFRGRAAISALRLPEIAVRHIRVPHDRIEDPAEFLAQEVAQQPADSGGELSFCPLPVADLLEHGEQKREFMCCITEESVVKAHINLIEDLGLTPVAIDLDTCAQVRPFLAHAGADASFLFVDIGCHCTRITVVRSGQPMLMRTVPIGGSELAAALHNKLQLDVDAILDLAEDDADRDQVEALVTTALAEQLDFILSRVGDCVRYCASLHQGRAVAWLRLSGGAAGLPGVVPYLGQRLGLRAELADPFAALGLPGVEDWRRLGPRGYATALGLALRGMAA